MDCWMAGRYPYQACPGEDALLPLYELLGCDEDIV